MTRADRTSGRLAAVLLLCTLACEAEDASLDVPLDPQTGLRIAEIPPLPPVPQWEDNPYTEQKAKLGQALFSDPRLSGSGQGTCGNCHLPSGWFQSSTPTDVPDRVYPMLGPALHRNAPSLLDIVYAPMMRWDGSHFTDLYDVMVLPYAEANMNLSRLGPEAGEEVDIPSAQLALYDKFTVEIPGYADLFEEAFDVDVHEQSPQEIWRYAGMALASYISRATSHGSVFDAWNQGEDVELSDAAIRGAQLFVGEANCVVCHSGPLLSDFEFHNVSTSPPGPDGTRADEGRYLVTGNEEDRGAFLTPMLRSASKTSPYFHEGIITSVRAVVQQKSGEAARMDPNYDPLVEVTPELSDAQVEDLVEFLKSLEGAPIDPTYLLMIDTLPE